MNILLLYHKFHAYNCIYLNIAITKMVVNQGQPFLFATSYHLAGSYLRVSASWRDE